MLAGLLSGLWDLWRNRTLADLFTSTGPTAALTGLISVLPRAAVFLLEMFTEVVNNVIQDQDPRPEGGPPIITPELALTGVGVWQGLSLPRRFTFVSGWEPRATPVAPGTRATNRSADTLARQTLSLLIHPAERARFVAPAQKFSVTMLPPPEPDDESPTYGSLLVGYDGSLEAEKEIGQGIIARIELDGRGFHEFLWGGSRGIKGRLGAGTFRQTFLRPVRFTSVPGIEIRFTPAVSLALGVTGGPEENSFKPAITFRVALNDREDRVSFLPTDSLLGQLLPTDGITLPIDAALEWTIGQGWRFAGFGEAASGILIDAGAPQRIEPPRDPAADFDEPPNPPRLPATEVVTPLNTRLGPLSVHERRLEVTTASDGDGATLNLAVTTTVSLNIGPVRVAVSGLGVRITLRLFSEFENVDELFDLSVGDADAHRPRRVDRRRRGVGRRVHSAHRRCRRRGHLARRHRPAAG